ncbi:alkaline phosphatase family protein [Bacteroidales bacterium OttesenSCG-928-M11]|nr:alkaline phosphatase family protein [Bacteroidales bacterium OttesenSCG-928-M11]
MKRLLSSLIAILTISGLNAQQQQAEIPKLVVSIVVDQLRGDYLHYFSSTFGEKGFKRLMNEGLVYHQVDCDFQSVNETSAIASLYAGTYPYYHGIVDNTKYDPISKKVISIFADNDYLGNYTSDQFSPKILQSSTFSDELKVATNGACDVYAIASNAEAAIAAGGRYANSVFWLDNHNGKWATSTYYPDVPWFIDRFNSSEAFGASSNDRTWIQSLSHFNGFPYSGTRNYFKYTFSKTDLDNYRKIKQTALVNEQITNLALRFLEYGGFANRTNPDVLSLIYYAGNYKYASYTDAYNYEIQDTYYQLDKQLEKLFDAIEKRVGLKNTLIVLTSTGYYDSWAETASDFGPMGEFYPGRCTALLNMYLMATYGNGNWVEAYHNNQIYLNKKLVEEKEINWANFQADAAGFVSQFSGVQDVTTLREWLVDDAGRSSSFRKGMNKKVSGHLFIELQPGWISVNEDKTQIDSFQRNTAILHPAFFWGGNVKKEHVYRPIKATEIAPTLSFIMRIRPPNGTKELPLREFQP